MIRINLLPPEYEAAQSKREQQIYFGGIGAAVVFLLVGVWMFQAHRASALETKIANAQAELAKYQVIISQIEQIEQDKGRLSAKREVIRGLNQARLAYPVFFEDLLPIIPAEAWLTNMNLVDQGGGTIKVTLAAQALSNYALATWLTNLQQAKHYSAVDLSPISYGPRPSGNGQVLSFSITCVYKHSGPFPLQEYN